MKWFVESPLAFLCAAMLVGCERSSEIKVYRVSKAPLEEAAPDQQNAMPTNAASPAMPGGIAPMASTGGITSPNWQPQPASQMRQASFLVTGDNGATVDISLVTLGPAAGNVLDNVNRWLSQIGQAPISEQKLDEIAQRIATSIGEATVVDLVGLPNGADPAKDGRIIAAMATTSGSTLFFKMRGNAGLTEAQKPDFIKWVSAVCNERGQDKSSAATAISPPETNHPQIKWQMPVGWTEVAPSAMRYASFLATAPGGNKVDVSIVTFPGDGGSDADNVNRWRQQLGLPPMEAAAIASNIVPVKTPEAAFSTIDLAGANARTTAAWTRSHGRVWFFKATGSTAGVEKEKSNFLKFVESVRF